jgi:AraC-like DNA-binding protein
MASFAAFLGVLVLLGALQGFIISSLLFFSKNNRQPYRILATIILLISLACFNLYGANKNWFGSDILRFLADIIPLVIIMPLGPLLYFYVLSVTDPSFRLTKKQRPYFYPAIIDLVPTITIIIFIAGLILRVFKNRPGPWGYFIDTYNVYSDMPRWVSVTVYLWLSAKHLSKLKTSVGTADGQHGASIKWLDQLVRVFTVFQVIWFVYLVPYVIPQYSNRLLDAVDWYPLYIPMAAIVYWLGIKGYMVSQNTLALVKKASSPQQALPAATVQQAIYALKCSMERDSLFLNPAVNLDVVAQHTGLPQKTISAVLNQHLHKSFNEFVNEYRICAFIEKMQQPGMDNLTIAGIALDCGFNSQATFQRTFKQVTGMPPTEYRKTLFATH